MPNNKGAEKANLHRDGGWPKVLKASQQPKQNRNVNSRLRNKHTVADMMASWVIHGTVALSSETLLQEYTFKEPNPNEY